VKNTVVLRFRKNKNACGQQAYRDAKIRLKSYSEIRKLQGSPLATAQKK
jgi:hypothetical protein